MNTELSDLRFCGKWYKFLKAYLDHDSTMANSKLVQAIFIHFNLSKFHVLGSSIFLRYLDLKDLQGWNIQLVCTRNQTKTTEFNVIKCSNNIKDKIYKF